MSNFILPANKRFVCPYNDGGGGGGGMPTEGF